MWKEEERREQRKVEGMGGGEVNMVRSHNILEQNCLFETKHFVQCIEKY